MFAFVFFRLLFSSDAFSIGFCMTRLTKYLKVGIRFVAQVLIIQVMDG